MNAPTRAQDRSGADMAAQTVLAALGRGADTARPISSFAEQFGWTRRQVELALRALRLEGWPIGSGRSGVYLADAKELDATIASLQRRIVSQYLTLRKQRELRAQMQQRLIQQISIWGAA